MLLSRRSFFLSAPALATIRPALQATPETGISSGGIGLSLAEIRELYDELPVGQDYGSFAEQQTGATLFIDFGDDDIARTIWVFGQLETDTLALLIAQLSPSDAVIEHRFGMAAYAGSMANLRVEILRSDGIDRLAGRRAKLMAKYTLLPGEPEIARDLLISLELVD